MGKEFQYRYAIFLGLLTLAAVIFAGFNVFVAEPKFHAPYDGVWWMEQNDATGSWLKAQRVAESGPGDNAGLRAGDRLVAINGNPASSFARLTQAQFNAGSYNKVTYSVVRNGVTLDAPVILVPADRSINLGLRLIALVYLAIGLFILLRRWTAPKSLHFYIFCLVSFVFYAFKYTGKLNQFDQIIYWSNVVAWLLQPALFLHFALTFPEQKQFLRRHPWTAYLVYLPGLVLLTLHVMVMRFASPSETLRWNLDRVQMSYLASGFVLAAVVLWHSYRNADSPILRQQMKWVTRGTIMAIAPFTLFYVIPYLHGTAPTTGMKISVLSLIFLPLTFGYAIVRYRLMDVDLIFKRGMAYTIATASIVGMYFGTVALVGAAVQKTVPNTGPAGLIVAITITALLFDPVKNWIQQHLDKFFYRKRYDYRRTLVAFGRDLNSETDLNKMFDLVVERLSQTLFVARLAIFTAASDDSGNFHLAKSYGITWADQLDLSFLTAERPELAEGHLFFDNTHQAVRESSTAQETIRRLDLNYYIPCTVQKRVVAVLGLGKTMEGDFLSSEDVQLLETLAGYLGIAIQNARLYASLEQKVSEYERLKDFNENIVESISVGVLAVDLADRIESWNSQMEVMYALPRSEAIGKPISEVFSNTFVEEFYRVRQNAGIHNLYKFRLGTHAGDTRVANVAIAPLVTKRFNVIGRIIIIDDITERIGLESQLSQAEKMSSIGLLAAGVAHEVNTPLAVISSYAQMLAKQVSGDEKKSSLLEKITRQTFRASEIVNNLLNFSRTSGTEFAQIDINKIIVDTLALLEHQFKTGRVKVQDDLAANLPPIHGNPGKLQQVFLNLFLNAKDAMHEGGVLKVSTSNNATGVHVSVVDSGSGIAPEHIARIYDPFFTTKTTNGSGERRGTGLGLSVTYGIIQEHAGKIRVESQPGAGTQFHLDFPVIPVSARKTVNA
jgi:two-component system NtrC family sensor kinase